MNITASIEFKQLNYTVKENLFSNSVKSILKNINGEFKSCELSAIVGPSGSGKTSLLNVLSGFVNQSVSGSIKINGDEIKCDSFKKLSTYIMQEENLHKLLTVYEAMTFAVKFKTGNVYNKKQRHSKIVSILEVLGLDDQVNTYTGMLSGGEQKRLSIAVELVDDPSVIFLDEPTTGLDSSSSTQCMQLLKKLALEGKTIVCTIHTPSALLLRLFDHLYAMANGECIYSGSSANLVPFLKELDLICPEIYTPSDFLLEIATNEYGPQNNRLVKKISNGLCEQWRDSANNNNNNNNEVCGIQNDTNLISDMRLNYSATFVYQFTLLMIRNYLFSMRDSTLMVIRVAIHIFVGLSIGFLYYGIGNDAAQIINIYRFVSISVGFLAYSGFYSLMVRYPLELHITKREHFNRWYSASSYYLALVTTDIPVIVSCSLFFICIIGVLTDQPLEGFRVLNFLIIAILTSFTAQSLGLLMGSMFELKTALIMAALLMAAHSLFGGLFILAADIPPAWQWLFDTTYLKYSMDGLSALVFGYNRKKLDCSENYCHFQTPKKFLTMLGCEENLPQVYFAITITLFITHITTFCIMRYRLKN